MLPYILEIDGKILLWIQDFLRFDWLNPIVLFVTRLGDGGTVWIVLAALLLIGKKYRKTGGSMAIALLLGYLGTNLLLKNLVMRPRPFDAIPQLQALVHAGGWSFPSGHSTSSMAAGVVMFRQLPRPIGALALILAILICLSRLYVGALSPYIESVTTSCLDTACSQSPSEAGKRAGLLCFARFLIKSLFKRATSSTAKPGNGTEPTSGCWTMRKFIEKGATQ